MIVDRRLPPLFTATDNVSELLSSFAQTPAWYDNPRMQCICRLDYSGFMIAEEAMTESERERDRAGPFLRQLGLHSQLGTGVVMPSGELASFSFERREGQAPFSAATIAWFDSLRPHLARASLMAARIQLDRAQASLAAMSAIGVPAAVLAPKGVVLAVNAQFEGLGDVLRPAAMGRLSLTDRRAHSLYQAAIEADTEPGPILSIPLRLPDGRCVVLHVLPLRRSATDVFTRGVAMVLVTGLAMDENVPADAMLRGLFDLSAAEAAVAAALAKGLSVKAVAAQRGIGITTARTHLAQIFRKTGTSQQHQLVALLKGLAVRLH